MNEITSSRFQRATKNLSQKNEEKIDRALGEKLIEFRTLLEQMSNCFLQDQTFKINTQINNRLEQVRNHLNEIEARSEGVSKRHSNDASNGSLQLENAQKRCIELEKVIASFETKYASIRSQARKWTRINLVILLGTILSCLILVTYFYSATALKRSELSSLDWQIQNAEQKLLTTRKHYASLGSDYGFELINSRGRTLISLNPNLKFQKDPLVGIQLTTNYWQIAKD